MFNPRFKAAGGVMMIGLLASLTSAHAVQCQGYGGFGPWLEAFKKEAVSTGISRRVAAGALKGITYNKRVIALDRDQRAFKMSFEQFAKRRISAGRLSKGRKMLAHHAALLKRIERRYGVPGPVLVAIWGLETDYGVNMGRMSAVRSLATLAYDCRRTEMFQNELLSALKIIDRGDMARESMRGAWAGELGQTQFLASNYVKFAVDFDRNGRRDLIRSVPDVLASTANYLKGFGWRRGGSWSPGSRNFKVLKEWNRSTIYQKTIALFATRLAGR
jgi:lytic murein transglycosylase